MGYIQPVQALACNELMFFGQIRIACVFDHCVFPKFALMVKLRHVTTVIIAKQFRCPFELSGILWRLGTD